MLMCRVVGKHSDIENPQGRVIHYIGLKLLPDETEPFMGGNLTVPVSECMWDSVKLGDNISMKVTFGM